MTLNLVVFSDAFMGNLPDVGTQGGHLIVLMKEGIFSPVCWQSKRSRRMVQSTLAGETLSLADGIDHTIFLSSLYSELTTGNVTQAHLAGDMCHRQLLSCGCHQVHQVCDREKTRAKTNIILIVNSSNNIIS